LRLIGPCRIGRDRNSSRLLKETMKIVSFHKSLPIKRAHAPIESGRSIGKIVLAGF
jgi:hypothetical protein